MRHYKMYFINLSFIFLFFQISISFAQEEIKGLIFNEVYLNKDKPGKSWIEIYNPTKNNLILEAVRYSHIKTTNMLPVSSKDKGGILLEPGGYLILSAEKSDVKFQAKTVSILLDVLSNFDTGGFMVLTTKSLGLAGVDAFKYGDPNKTAGLKNYKDKPLLNLSTNGKSFSRKLNNNNGIISVSDFYETAPTKGYANNKRED